MGRTNLCPDYAYRCALVSAPRTEEVQLAGVPRRFIGNPWLEIAIGHFANAAELRHSCLLRLVGNLVYPAPDEIWPRRFGFIPWLLGRQ